jgi:hypothetical protein
MLESGALFTANAVFSDLTDGYERWILSAEVKRALSEAAGQLRSGNKRFVLRSDGRTVSIAPETYNENLYLKRAISLGTYLVVHDGFDPSSVYVKGGNANPCPQCHPGGAHCQSPGKRSILLPIEEP